MSIIRTNTDELISNLVEQLEEVDIQKIKMQSICDGGPRLPSTGECGGPRLRMIAYDDMV